MKRIKPIKKESENERIARLKKEKQDKINRKQKDIERIESKDKAKYSHNWHNEMEFDRLKGSGKPYPQYCKNCGVSFLMFKIDPQICLKSKDDANNSK